MKRYRKALLVMSPVLLVILILTIPARGWTRSSLLPAYTKLFYGTNVGRLFDSNFRPINEQLKTNKFVFIDKKTLPYESQGGLSSYEPLNGCEVVGYEGINETITCQKVDEFKPASFSDNFIKRWAEHSPQFVQFLEENGWRKEFPDQPSFIELFNHPKNSGNWLTYVKNHRKVHCYLTIAYNPPYPNLDDQMWIHEECTREINFFKGY
jgi:hypothetical protein